jgi:membrane-associated phospholipid phosphatase
MNIAALAVSIGALAQEDAVSSSPYHLRWQYDAPIVALGAAAFSAAFVGYPPASCLPSCTPPPGMLAIDRAAVGNYSPRAHSIANVVVAGLVLAPLALDAVDTRFSGWMEDSFVFAESLLLAQGATQLAKSAVDRNAPLVFAPEARREDLESPDASRSFFSGHTSTSFAAATAYSITFWKRHPDSPWRFVVAGVSHALALGVGFLKIEAGYHYPTDVAAGALAGSGIALLNGTLHGTW